MAFVVLTAFFVLLLRHELRRTPRFVHPPIAPTTSWKRFSSDKGHFSIVYPGVPETTNILADSGTTNIEMHLFYVNPNPQNSFCAGYSDSPMFAMAAKISDPQEFLEKSQSLMVSNVRGKVVYQRASTFNDFPAREFECVAGGKANYSTRVKYILAGQRIYQIYVVFLTADPYPRECATFFNSFRIQSYTNAVP